MATEVSGNDRCLSGSRKRAIRAKNGANLHNRILGLGLELCRQVLGLAGVRSRVRVAPLTVSRPQARAMRSVRAKACRMP